MNNAEFLKRVGEILGERESHYGFCEQHFARTVAMVNAAIGTNMTPSDWPIVMICDKLARNGGPSFTVDTAYDLAGYAALLARLTDSDKPHNVAGTSQGGAHGNQHGRPTAAGSGNVSAKAGAGRASVHGDQRGGLGQHDVGNQPPAGASVSERVLPRDGLAAADDCVSAGAVAAKSNGGPFKKARWSWSGIVIDMGWVFVAVSGTAVAAVVFTAMILGADIFFRDR